MFQTKQNLLKLTFGINFIKQNNGLGGLCDFDSTNLLAEIYMQSNILGFMFLIPCILVGGTSVAIVYKLRQSSKTSSGTVFVSISAS